MAFAINKWRVESSAEVRGSISAVNISQFTNDFAFQLVNPNADGITFTIQNAGLTALGGMGGSLGYAGIANSCGGEVRFV